MTIDLNGTAVAQTVPFQALYQNFRLLTTLSFAEVAQFGGSIGFSPDASDSFQLFAAAQNGGIGVCNTQNGFVAPIMSGAFNAGTTFNKGMYERQRVWNLNPNGLAGGANGSKYNTLVTESTLNQMYRSHIYNVQGAGADAAGLHIWQCAISGVIMLKHLHSFFDKCPLMRGVYFRLTLNLNQPTIGFSVTGAGKVLASTSIISPLGGVQPLLVASTAAGCGGNTLVAGNYTVSLAVGSKCLNSAQVANGHTIEASLSKSVMLYAPSYVFNPSFEQAYLSQSVKTIEYEDLYFYQVMNVGTGTNIQQLISNGIAGIKNVLVIPFYDKSSAVQAGLDPLQSPFDTCGGGGTSPMAFLNNWNIVVSGQPALYQAERYQFSNFLHNLNGINSVNGSQIEGVSSGLISQHDFQQSYCYHYVNVERMLPVERSVPKSVSITGTNATAYMLNLYVFISYFSSLQVDVMSGSRVS